MASDHQRLVAEALLKAERKLEAIKKIIDEPQPSLQQYEKIKKILEAEG